MTASSRDAEWTKLMRAALAGDADAYRQLLLSVTPYIRAVARKRNTGMAAADEEAEDIVQEVLLAIHLKRGTWDPSRSIGPWIHAIIRNKIIDAFRRRGGRLNVPIEEVTNVLRTEEPKNDISTRAIEVMIGQLKTSQSEIVQSISINGQSIRDTAARLRMSEGAVRVSLHRALKALAALYRAGAYED
ncbi:sigma-70 family RNA polymerase sigma factor [Bradyrhizobium sp. 180]|uniref:sigma-70 family RNA polymerase sigma factor n=1 Tax=unclassified Bradyrhizobium TaxID=2631580 RepID=UPI001FF7B9D3|nr:MULTISPECIES: sigma-70 family RNA polymerase sigma factor [unclassified Bradyrhizobium]MCK1492139.1 sigma-70 family RNA polymerase sigma factor [Bradyrhizobium sp. 180]MCK1719493.1 sigma-70 family RNA polymerase sigma factor [Bradyrhizobium sp. 141]